MASDLATADAVARLFTAAGRRYGKVECQLFLEALADIGDEELRAAVRTIVSREEWVGARGPSPGMVRAVVSATRRRAELDRPALPPPRADRAEALTHLAAMRRELAGLARSTNEPKEIS